MSKPKHIHVPIPLMLALYEAVGHYWNRPMDTLKKSKNSYDCVWNSGVCMGVTLMMDWLAENFEASHGRSFDVFRLRQTLSSADPEAAAGSREDSGESIASFSIDRQQT